MAADDCYDTNTDLYRDPALARALTTGAAIVVAVVLGLLVAGAGLLRNRPLTQIDQRVRGSHREVPRRGTTEASSRLRATKHTVETFQLGPCGG